MKIRNFNITSAEALDLEFTPDSSVCVIRGRYSELVLDMLRELIGDYGAVDSPDRIDDGRFVIHAGVEMDSKDYNVCYIRNADFIGDNRIAVNFAPSSLDFSLDDTYEFDAKRIARNTDSSNVFDDSQLVSDTRLSESDRRMMSFDCFLESLSQANDRPIFIYGLFDRIDASVDTADILDKLTDLGMQVFVAVCEGYPKHRLSHKSVQVVQV